MKAMVKVWMLALGVLAFLVPAPIALAQCGSPAKAVKPTAWHPQMGSARLVLAVDGDHPDGGGTASIVGMWHVVFTGQTMNGGAYTLPEPLDNSVVVWHSDGTEIMNSSRPAQDGNFCMGVWQQTGKWQYFLNHIPWQGNDPSGNPQGGAQLLEQVTLSPDGNHYSGRFTFQAYDLSGSPTLEVTGVLTATRITTSTPFGSLL
ncbi:MAG TPA: hypothetical protein VMD55_11705 [Terracidiphilus sp.]|nr:hypothetical protein [Terracidiphilus sp.]